MDQDSRNQGASTAPLRLDNNASHVRSNPLVFQNRLVMMPNRSRSHLAPFQTSQYRVQAMDTCPAFALDHAVTDALLNGSKR